MKPADLLWAHLVFCLQGCGDLIALFEEEEQRREAELEEVRRKGEVEGVWEVQKILEVKTRKVSFSLLVLAAAP